MAIPINCKASPLPNDSPSRCETSTNFCLPVHTSTIIIFATRSAKSMTHAHVLSEIEKSEVRKSKIHLLGLASGAHDLYFMLGRQSYATLT